MQPGSAASRVSRRANAQTLQQGLGLRRVDPVDPLRHRHGLQVPGQDVRQALRHPEGLQDARQVRAQGHRVDSGHSRGQGQLHLQGEELTGLFLSCQNIF